MDFLFKLLINTFAVTALVFSCYSRTFSIADTRKREHATSFLMFGVGVFIVTYLLSSAKISMGFAFGLFAVFSMLRYRTESISVKEMTYLFLVIAMSLLSAVSDTSLFELVILQTIMYGSARVCDSVLSGPEWAEKHVQYENIENIKPQNRALLIEDLKLRTGLDIQDVEIGDIDFLRDTAALRIFHLVPSKAKLRSSKAKLCSVEGE
jgi:hypothetical protein